MWEGWSSFIAIRRIDDASLAKSRMTDCPRWTGIIELKLVISLTTQRQAESLL